MEQAVSQDPNLDAGLPDHAGQFDSVHGRSQYLTFILAGEEYAVDILKVQEIKGYDLTTSIPNTAPYISGAMNLRGAIVPVVDLRLRFEMEPTTEALSTVVIVVRVDDDGTERTVGIVVDAVSEVYNLDAQSLQPPPAVGGTVHTEFVKGLATAGDTMLIVLDIDRLVMDGVLRSATTVG